MVARSPLFVVLLALPGLVRSRPCLGCCSHGRFKNATAAGGCTDCPRGKFKRVVPPWEDASWDSDDCDECMPGTYTDVRASTKCEECTPGRFADNFAAKRCARCPAGKWSSSVRAEMCVPCNGGRFGPAHLFPNSSSVCLACPAGRTSTAGSAVCGELVCPLGKFARHDARFSNTARDYCLNCPSGRYGVTSGHVHVPRGMSYACDACPAGKYQRMYGRGTCDSCPAGKHQYGEGRARCVADEVDPHWAPSGHPQGYCPVGKYSEVLMLDKAPPAPGPERVFISEYVEGTSFTKALELFNPTERTIVLDGARLQWHHNGHTYTADRTFDVALDGHAIPALGTLVLCRRPGASKSAYTMVPADRCDIHVGYDSTASHAVLHNGDDAIQYLVDARVVDAIGRVGEDPGKCWRDAITGKCATKDATLVRNYAVTSGDPVWDLQQWTVHAVDRVRGLGHHLHEHVAPPPVERQMVRECYVCPRGKFGLGWRSTTCEGCANNTYAPREGAARCLKCPAGKHAAAGHEHCTWIQDKAQTTSCPLGTFISNDSPTWLDSTATPECTPCRPGRFGIKAPGLRDGEDKACHMCDVGYHTPHAGSTRCDACPAGTFGLMFMGMPTCRDCAQGQYTVHNASTACHGARVCSHTSCFYRQGSSAFKRFTAASFAAGHVPVGWDWTHRLRVDGDPARVLAPHKVMVVKSHMDEAHGTHHKCTYGRHPLDGFRPDLVTNCTCVCW